MPDFVDDVLSRFERIGLSAATELIKQWLDRPEV
jgi:hypothetical protein